MTHQCTHGEIWHDDDIFELTILIWVIWFAANF